MITIEQLYHLFRSHPFVCTDTRKIRPGSIFFGLKGENFDGNVFAAKALEGGAAYAVIDNKEYQKDDRFILVENTLSTLQQLAVFHRKHFSIPIIAITGTNGKTTTKELISNVLKQKLNIVATSGNFNNHIGVPLTLLSITDQTEIAVVEMGANHPGEINLLCQLAKPNFGLITNIGKAHLEGFGSIEGIIKTKNELYDFLKSNRGHVFVNHENNILIDLSKNIPRTTYGISTEADNYFIPGEPNLFAEIFWQRDTDTKIDIISQLIGNYNAENIMAAVSVGNYFGVEPEKIALAIQKYKPDNNRSQIIKTKNNSIILDAYNANPTSMLVSLENFASLKADNKMVIIGDMLELGKDAETEHLKIVQLLEKLKLKQVFLVGTQFSKQCNPQKMICFPDTAHARDWFIANPVKGAYFLIKGSRGMHLEELIENV